MKLKTIFLLVVIYILIILNLLEYYRLGLEPWIPILFITGRDYWIFQAIITVPYSLLLLFVTYKIMIRFKIIKIDSHVWKKLNDPKAFLYFSPSLSIIELESFIYPLYFFYIFDSIYLILIRFNVFSIDKANKLLSDFGIQSIFVLSYMIITIILNIVLVKKEVDKLFPTDCKKGILSIFIVIGYWVALMIFFR